MCTHYTYITPLQPLSDPDNNQSSYDDPLQRIRFPDSGLYQRTTEPEQPPFPTISGKVSPTSINPHFIKQSDSLQCPVAASRHNLHVSVARQLEPER